MHDRRLPLTVIGGFLGAGKTTLLNRMLSQAQGRRLAVLVNDFGALNIDAALVAGQDGTTMALTNGCVCCQIGGDLTAALVAVLDRQERFDAIVIEASGVSDPWRIAQVGLADPSLALDAVIVMLDASMAPEQAADPLLADTMRRQLRSADLVVVNKCDLVGASEMVRLRAWLDDVIGAAPRYETCHGELPEAMRRGPREDGCRVHPATSSTAHGHGNQESQGGGHAHGHDPGHGDLFETWLHRPAAPLDAGALRALLRRMPAGVLRLKGLVPTHEHPLAELQFAGRHGSLRPAAADPASAEWGIVAIGLKGCLPRAALDAAFTAAAARHAGDG